MFNLYFSRLPFFFLHCALPLFLIIFLYFSPCYWYCQSGGYGTSLPLEVGNEGAGQGDYEQGIIKGDAINEVRGKVRRKLKVKGLNK
jgi:hypothetical protein